MSFCLWAMLYFLVVSGSECVTDAGRAFKSSRHFAACLFASAGFFNDSAVVFAFGINIAAIVVCATDNQLYSRSLAGLGSGIATAVLVILWPIHKLICTRTPLRTWVRMMDHIMGTVIGFWVVLANHEKGTDFEEVCFKQLAFKVHITQEKAFNLLAFGLGCVIGPWGVLQSVVGLRLDLPAAVVKMLSRPVLGNGDKSYITIPSTWRVYGHRTISILAALITFAYVWTCLWILIRLRDDSGLLSGLSTQDYSWGFGQIVALVAWLPVIVDFFSVLRGE